MSHEISKVYDDGWDDQRFIYDEDGEKTLESAKARNQHAVKMLDSYRHKRHILTFMGAWQLAKKAPLAKVHGVDLSANQIAAANTLVDEDVKDRLSFSVGDAADFHLDRTFNLIFSNAAMHWVENRYMVVSGQKRDQATSSSGIVSKTLISIAEADPIIDVMLTRTKVLTR